MSARELELRLGEVQACVAPERGAIVTRLNVRGVELLHLDRATLDNPDQHVRGGIPLMHPFCGKLANNTLDSTGTTIAQHGFARARAWQVAERTPASLHLSWEADDAALAVFPWPHRLRHSVLLVENGLHAELRLENTGDKPMPVSPGWHPYFRCPAAKKIDVCGDTDATRQVFHDNAEVNIGIPAPPTGEATYSIPGMGTMRLTCSPAFGIIQHWTIPGHDFVCIEPFHAAPNALNEGRALVVAPGRCETLWMRLERIA